METLDDYRGLSFRRPVLAAIFALGLLSLTGIPLTSGFIAKFYIFSAAARGGGWTLVIVGLVNSGISAFYYLRVLVTIYSRPEGPAETTPGAGISSGIALAACAAVIVVLGVYPAPIIALAELVTRRMGF